MKDKNKILIIFGRNNHILSWAIRLFEWSRWSHCGIVDGDYVIEATAFGGVVRTPLRTFKKRYRRFEFAYLPCDDSEKVIERAKQEIGKKYDYLAIFGIFFRRGWNDKDKWFCSELVAYASGIFRYKRISRVTPEDLYKVSIP